MRDGTRLTTLSSDFARGSSPNSRRPMSRPVTNATQVRSHGLRLSVSRRFGKNEDVAQRQYHLLQARMFGNPAGSSVYGETLSACWIDTTPVHTMLLRHCKIASVGASWLMKIGERKEVRRWCCAWRSASWISGTCPTFARLRLLLPRLDRTPRPPAFHPRPPFHLNSIEGCTCHTRGFPSHPAAFRPSTAGHRPVA